MGQVEGVLQSGFSVHAAFVNHDAVYMNEPPFEGLNDVGFLQMTVYTIVGEYYLDCTSQ
jgi:hypothetical protein